jgi:hypothetical protein
MAEKVERLTYKIQFDAESGTSTIRGLDGTIKATMVSTQKLRQEYGNFATQIKATNAEINNLSGGVNGKGGLNGMSAASGSASAAALELGRVVSDAPYGIRGMANNVSQLASQLFFMASQQEIATVATKSDTVAKTTNTTATVAATTATVGFAGALRMMWTALMGPLGILLALQAVIAAADYFFGGMKKAEDSTKKLNDELSKTSSTVASSTAELEVYAKVYKEADVGTQKHTNALKELKKLGFDPATKAIDDFIIANQKKLADDKKYWEDKRDAAEYGGAEYLDAVKKVAQTELNITKNTAERERTIEQAKFDFKMSVMDAAASSFSSLSILAKEGSDLSKALALTGILVDTAAGLMAGLRIAQEQSLLAPPVSTYAFPLFYAAQTAAVLGAAAQAKRIISSGGSGTPSATVASSGSGGGGSTFNPNFNIVGASGSNQLAETVAGQIGEPTRAYVVYDDIATAGEIEANAIEASGI